MMTFQQSQQGCSDSIGRTHVFECLTTGSILTEVSGLSGGGHVQRLTGLAMGDDGEISHRPGLRNSETLLDMHQVASDLV